MLTWTHGSSVQLKHTQQGPIHVKDELLNVTIKYCDLQCTKNKNKNAYRRSVKDDVGSERSTFKMLLGGTYTNLVKDGLKIGMNNGIRS